MGKAKVFLIRHCEPEGHEQKLFNGHNDAPLIEKGRKQAELLRQRFQNEDVHAVYSSPLKRARHTAKLVFGEKVIILVEQDLIERYFGIVDGVPLDEAKKRHKNAEDVYEGRARTVLPGVEPLSDVRKRAYKKFKEILEANPEKNIVLVGHVMWIKSLLSKILGLPITRTDDVGRVGTSSATTLEVEYSRSKKPRKITVFEIGDLKHLK